MTLRGNNFSPLAVRRGRLLVTPDTDMGVLIALVRDNVVTLA